MKLLLIIYDSAIDESVTNILKESGVQGFTKLFDAHGMGGAGYKAGNPVFPDSNNVILVGLPEEKVHSLVDKLKELKASYRKNPGMTFYVLEAKEL